MNEDKQITIAEGANDTGKPRVDLEGDQFDVVIDQKGYEVLWEKAVRCPCKPKGLDALSSCKNCGSTGWVYINTVKTKMLMQSISFSGKRLDWTEEKSGTVNITPRNRDHVGYNDRITVVDSESIHSEVIYPVNFQNEMYSFLMYPATEIIEAYVFISPDVKLSLMDLDTDVSLEFDGSVLKFADKFYDKPKMAVTIRYKHNVQFHVLEVLRDIRNSYAIIDGANTQEIMPMAMIARRAHFVHDPVDFNGDGLFDNSYSTEPPCPPCESD